MLQCSEVDREPILGPIAASYPHCSLTAVEVPAAPAGLATWYAEVRLSP
jgi:hypothetical protein